MPSLQIRQVPADVYNALSLRATLAHRSLAQQTLAELTQALGGGKQRRLQVLQNIRQRQQQRGTHSELPDSQELVRQDRDR